MIDKEKRKARTRAYYWRTEKGVYDPPPTKIVNAVVDAYPYRIVPNHWREKAPNRDRRNLHEIDSPLVADLMRGKTLFVDYEVPLGKRDAQNPYRALYAYFMYRGYRLRVHLVDDENTQMYRRLLMWLEPIKPVRMGMVRDAKAA